MVNAFAALLSGLVAFLVSHLPLSPFANLAFDSTGFAGTTLGTVLGWVNWVIPFGPMLALFTAWVAACFAFSVAVWVVRRFMRQVPTVVSTVSLSDN